MPAGGQDDPTILIWDILAKSPVCVCKKTFDRPFVATKLKFTPHFDHIFMVGGQDAVHVWNLDERSKKATNFIVPLGKIKRTISDMVVCTSTGKASADYIFCGTNSGDIVKLYVRAHHMLLRILNFLFVNWFFQKKKYFDS